MGYFIPKDEREHARGAQGHNVPDTCLRCGAPFLDHHNGRCPPTERTQERARLTRAIMRAVPEN